MTVSVCDRPVTVPLAGTGVCEPDIAVTTTEVDIGNVTLWTTESAAVAVGNKASEDLVVSEVNVSGGNAAAFDITDPNASDRWAQGTVVQNTGGETIGLAGIQDLINNWATETTVSCER